MTKNEFISQFTSALNRAKVADAEDIIEEYEEHFAFKLADGYSEEEIAAKLGDPAELAAQFGGAVAKTKKGGGQKALTVTGLCFADLFVGIFFICLIAFAIVIGASIIAFFLAAVGLVMGIEPVTAMPKVPSFLFAATFVALGVVFSGLFVYYTAFVRQVFRSYSRFHHNALAGANGTAVLPSLPITPQLEPKKNRHIRTMTVTALMVFIVLIIATVIVSAAMAGSIQFWHAWGWFGYNG